MKVSFLTADQDLLKLVGQIDLPNFIVASDYTLEGEDDRSQSHLVFIDLDDQTKGEEINRELMSALNVVRIIVFGQMAMKEVVAHQNSVFGGHGYLKKPIDIPIIEGVIQDYEIMTHVEENDLRDEENTLGDIDLSFIGLKVDEVDEVDELPVDEELDPLVKKELDKHSLTDSNEYLESKENKKIQSVFDQAFEEDVPSPVRESAGDTEEDLEVSDENDSTDVIDFDFTSSDGEEEQDSNEASENKEEVDFTASGLHVLSKDEESQDELGDDLVEGDLESGEPKELEEAELLVEDDALEVELTAVDDSETSSSDEVEELPLDPSEGEDNFVIEENNAPSEDEAGLNFDFGESDSGEDSTLLGAADTATKKIDSILADEEGPLERIESSSTQMLDIDDAPDEPEAIPVVGPIAMEEEISEGNGEIDLEVSGDSTLSGSSLSYNDQYQNEHGSCETVVIKSLNDEEATRIIDVTDHSGLKTGDFKLPTDTNISQSGMDNDVAPRDALQPRASSDFQQVHNELSGHHQEELVRLQGVLSSTRGDRESLILKLDKSEKESELLSSKNIGTQAELDETKIELGIIRKRHARELDELHFMLKLSDEKREISEAKLKKNQQELNLIENKVRIDLNQVKQREKDLENKLELITMDSESQLKTRDSKILELKRKIDSLEFNMENSIVREQKMKEDKVRVEERLEKIMKTLRGSIEVIEDDLDGKV